MSATRIFTFVGLALIFVALSLAAIGSFLPAIVVLSLVVLSGLGLALGAWFSRP